MRGRETIQVRDRRLAGAAGRMSRWLLARAGCALALLAGAYPSPAPADGALTDFQMEVLERRLAALRAPLRATVDLEPPAAPEGTESQPGAVAFGEEIAAGGWTAVGARLTSAVEAAVAERRDALRLDAEGAAEAGVQAETRTGAGYRIGSYRKRSRLFLVERILAPAVVSETEKLGPLSVRVWITPERRDALELFYLRSGGAVPPPRDRQTPPPDERFERAAGGPGGAEQHYRLRTHPADAPPLPEGDPGAGGDRLGIQRRNVVIEAGRDTWVRSGDDPTWRTAGMSDDDEDALRELLGAIAERIWAGEPVPQ